MSSDLERRIETMETQMRVMEHNSRQQDKYVRLVEHQLTIQKDRATFLENENKELRDLLEGQTGRPLTPSGL